MSKKWLDKARREAEDLSLSPNRIKEDIPPVVTLIEDPVKD